MSKIIEYLKKIRTAVYGKDVRESIAEAIEQCYHDGKAGAVDLIAREKLETVGKDLEYYKSYVTPKMFGAKGDGITDDSAAFQSAFNKAKKSIYS